MSSNSVVQEKVFQTAEELLDALSPRGSFFGQGDEPRRWIFRGHGDATYELLPQVLRRSRGRERPSYLYYKGEWHTIDDLFRRGALLIAEFSTLMRFLEVADQNGLAIPEDSVRQRDWFRWVEKMVIQSHTWADVNSDHEDLRWPSAATQSLMALAQHNGVPTRLLDWTFSSYTAAYFAASDAVGLVWKKRGRRPVGHENLSIWALSLALLENDQIKTTIELVTVPAATNPNLYAQRGVFTVRRERLRPDLSNSNHGDRTPLEQVIEAEFRNCSVESPILWHMKLPRTEAPKLLRLLSKDGIDRGRLFPGYAGVAKALLEQSYWNGNRG